MSKGIVILKPHELKKLRIYLNKLDELRGKEIEPDKDLSPLMGMYQLIDQIGDGDPIKAAYKHRNCIVGVDKAIRLSGGVKSETVH